MKRITKYDKKMMDFKKRYHKFHKNNMPTPFWDEERQTLEFVYYESPSDDLSQPQVYSNLYNAFENIIFDNFYYSFNCSHYESGFDENNNWVSKKVIGHLHEHDFDNVIRWVYASPESFSIDKVDEPLYSEQELRYIKRLQNFLLFLGYKDLTNYKAPVSRYRNKLRNKYKDYLYKGVNEKRFNDILNGKCYDLYVYEDGYENRLSNRKALVRDIDGKVLLEIQYTHYEIKKFSEVKNDIDIKLNDDQKVILHYFKILNRFDNKKDS